jgi:hypothetical protein
MCHHRCGGILDGGVTFVVKYGQLSTIYGPHDHTIDTLLHRDILMRFW